MFEFKNFDFQKGGIIFIYTHMFNRFLEHFKSQLGVPPVYKTLLLSPRLRLGRHGQGDLKEWTRESGTNIKIKNNFNQKRWLEKIFVIKNIIMKGDGVCPCVC